ncbi:hypothetical protein DSECCO2_585750 [anaerobic digester metagenome]
MIPSRWLFEGLATAYAKNTKFHRALAKIEKKELTYLLDYKNAAMSSVDFQEKRSEIFYAKKEVVERWDPNRTLNSYLNASVSMMDGRVLNSSRNEFLASIKIVKDNRLSTWNHNALVVILFALMINMVTALKLKYYFKE